MTHITYHTRRSGTDEKITTGAIHSTTALLADYTVIIQPTGHPIFMDDKGRRVNVYMRLNPEDHPGYLEAVETYRRDQQVVAKLAKDRQEQIDRLLADLSDEEILERLTK